MRKVLFILILCTILPFMLIASKVSFSDSCQNINLRNAGDFYSYVNDKYYKSSPEAYNRIAVVEFSEDCSLSISNDVLFFEGITTGERLCFSLVVSYQDGVYILDDSSISIQVKSGTSASIYLVIPTDDNLVSDYYEAAFDITAGYEAYRCYLNAYYEADTGTITNNIISFTADIIPNANSRSINLSDSECKQGILIGSYSYNFWIKGEEDVSNRLKLFVSASSDPNVADEEGFVLRKTDAEVSDDNNSIDFEIMIGNMWNRGIISTGTTMESVLGFEKNNQVLSDDGVQVYSVDGDIYFKVADEDKLDRLEAGVYRSYIYLHVIAIE